MNTNAGELEDGPTNGAPMYTDLRIKPLPPSLHLRLDINKEIVREIADNPLAIIEPNKEVTIEEVKRYLEAKHTTLWGSFSISSHKGLEKAAQWLQSEINQLYLFLRNPTD